MRLAGLYRMSEDVVYPSSVPSCLSRGSRCCPNGTKIYIIIFRTSISLNIAKNKDGWKLLISSKMETKEESDSSRTPSKTLVVVRSFVSHEIRSRIFHV